MIDPGSPLLLRAVEAARRALRDLEPEDVPAAVHRVAKSSARRLPPPLARSLVETLDDDAWLRDKASAAWAEADPDDPSPAKAASALFLLRPDAWEERLEEIAAEEEEASQATSADALRKLLQRREDELRSVKEKARAETDRAALAEAEAGRIKREARRQQRPADAGVDSAATRRAEAAELRIVELQRELDEADERLTRLREDLLRSRRAAREAGPVAPPSAWARRHPVETARLLDEMSAALRPGAVSEEPSPVVVSSVFNMPDGVAPDQAEAVTWLLGQPDQFTLVVDGYNLTFLMESETQFATATARARLEARLARLRRLATAPVRVVAVYDTRGDPADRRGPGGIEIRFVPSADDEIVALAASLPGAVVAVSNDRQVRERAQGAAVVLWARALADWMAGG